ncbi:SCP2 domain-containing protein [Aestuariibacter sp. A3R04]|uniref:ubiquinone biosynthesis accessory factor UbiJ n=1 Tax=Aestuariibacter sp. A3R04 TaxID=2841571 RepID=UPI001C099E06|nr:SCP2 sterol-binding domain-containing protein [Aestuariibacter sp. A3R04]
MPAQALFTATLETAMNQLLSLDEDSDDRLRQLAGKTLIVYIADTPIALRLVFADNVNVLAEQSTFSETVKALDKQSCCIQVSLDVLPQLKQSSRLTALIQEGKLTVEGELAVAQQASGLFQGLSIDWEEVVSQYTGDVVAHTLFASANRVHQTMLSVVNNAKAGLGNALTEEKQIAAPALAVTHFCDQVSDLRDDVERLQAKLNKLEAILLVKQEKTQ